MKNNNRISSVVLMLCLLVSSSVYAAVISVDLDTAAGTVAGDFTGSFATGTTITWNSLLIGGGGFVANLAIPVTSGALMTMDGTVAEGVQFTLGGTGQTYNGALWGSGTPAELRRDYAFIRADGGGGYGPQASLSFSFSGLTSGDTYDIKYFASANSASVTIGSTTIDVAVDSVGDFIGLTADSGGTIVGSFTQQGGQNDASMAGIQIRGSLGPNQAYDPTPIDGLVVEKTDSLELAWRNACAITDNPNDSVYVDVYFDTVSPPLAKVVDATVDVNSVDVAAGDVTKTYYWRVDTYRQGSATGIPIVGTEWSFTVTDNPPFVYAGDDMITWSDQPVSLDPSVVEKADSLWTDLTYAWTADPNAGVVFTDAFGKAPMVTITKGAPNADANVVTLTLVVDSEGSVAPPLTDTMTNYVYDDACLAAIGAGKIKDNPADRVGDCCITNLEDFAMLVQGWLDVLWIEDFAEMASAWLTNYQLTESVPSDVVYIAPWGKDSNPGIVAKPFLTIERARDAVREKIAKGMSRDVTVVLRGGEYFIDNAIRFDERDSGRDGRTVVYKAASGEKVSLYGGQRITGWQPVSQNVYRASVEQGRRFYRLLENEHSLVMARHPNKGSGYGGGLTNVDANIVSFPAEWVNYDFSDAMVFGWVGGDWFSALGEVSAVDTVDKTLTVNIPYKNFNSRLNIRGVLEHLDEEGEWCLKHNDGYIYCWPRKLPIEDQLIVPPTTVRVLDIRGSSIGDLVQNIRFEGITFIGSDYPSDDFQMIPEGISSMAPESQQGLIHIENATNVDIKFCRILGAGHAGVYMNHYVQNCSVYGCWIEDVGSFGIYLNGWQPGHGPFSNAEESYVNKNNLISNNFIHDFGQSIGHASGIQFWQSGNNEISHNIIARGPRSGIVYMGPCYRWMRKNCYGTVVTFENHYDFIHTRNNVIRDNEIFNVCRDSSDFGGINAAGTGVSNLWERNAIHDIDAPVEWDVWAHALFPDDGADHTIIRDNIVYECKGGNMTGGVIVKSIGIVVENNIFADNIHNRFATVEPYVEPGYDMVYRRNIMFGTAPHLYTTVNKTFNVWFTDPVVPPETPVVKELDFNLIYPSHDEMQTNRGWGWDVSSVELDPLFDRSNPDYNTHYTDFRLQATSPAFDLGFKSIAVDQIGLQDDFPFDRSLFFRKQAGDIIQAEDYNRMRGLHTKGGEGIDHIQPGAWAKYVNIDFGKGNLNEFVASLTYAETNMAACSIHLDSPDGQVIGQLTLGQTVAEVEPVEGVHTIYLVFENNQIELMDWFRFK